LRWGKQAPDLHRDVMVTVEAGAVTVEPDAVTVEAGAVTIEE